MTNSMKVTPPIAAIALGGLAVGAGVVVLTPASSATALAVLAFLAALAFGAIAVVLWRRPAQPQGNQQFVRLQEGGQYQSGQQTKARQWATLAASLTAIAMLVGLAAVWKSMAPEKTIAEPPGPLPATTSVVSAAPSPTPSPSPSPSPSSTPSADASPSAEASPTALPGVTYLDSMDPIEGYTKYGPAYFSAKRYPRSVTVSCYKAVSSSNEWNVAGRRTFSATLGIDDNADNAFGVVSEFIFYDHDNRQIGMPYNVSIGHPQKVTIDLTSVVRLRITCSGRDSKTNAQRSVYAVLADAYVAL